MDLDALVTVVIPSVRGDTVADTVRAVRAQTHGRWELIVVGQGQRDTVEANVDRAADASSGTTTSRSTAEAVR